jgi:hypothetical protein
VDTGYCFVLSHDFGPDYFDFLVFQPGTPGISYDPNAGLALDIYQDNFIRAYPGATSEAQLVQCDPSSDMFRCSFLGRNSFELCPQTSGPDTLYLGYTGRPDPNCSPIDSIRLVCTSNYTDNTTTSTSSPTTTAVVITTFSSSLSTTPATTSITSTSSASTTTAATTTTSNAPASPAVCNGGPFYLQVKEVFPGITEDNSFLQFNTSNEPNLPNASLGYCETLYTLDPATAHLVSTDGYTLATNANPPADGQLLFASASSLAQVTPLTCGIVLSVPPTLYCSNPNYFLQNTLYGGPEYITLTMVHSEMYGSFNLHVYCSSRSGSDPLVCITATAALP